MERSKHQFSTGKRALRGEPMVWLTASGLALGVIITLGLLALVATKGLETFWPKELVELTVVHDGVTEKTAGYIVQERQRRDPDGALHEEIQMFRGNGELYGDRFVFIDKSTIAFMEKPKDLLLVERLEGGNAIGRAVRKEQEKGKIFIVTADGREIGIPAVEALNIFAPNRAGFFRKLGEALRRGWEFVSAAPREANTEGGVFPALFGTVAMTLAMSLFVTPFGVIAAIYLREYAGQGPLVKLVRISVNNLAGVPSIVFGVFGLAFFVYFLGGVIDRSFFSENLPNPTFKSGGFLWASLTLALLTVPVMIVATEEALASVPRGVREAALASGASKWQMIQRVVLPASLPGILTGVILAMARGAGEVAPLMIVGVVKSAPALPVDFTAPFIHAQRQFMHLGFLLNYDT